MYANQSQFEFTATVAATPAVIDVPVGALVSSVTVINMTTGASAIFSQSMAADSLVVLGAGGGAGGVGLKTSAGITVLTGQTDSAGVTESTGFQMGTLADFNDTTGEVLLFLVNLRGL